MRISSLVTSTFLFLAAGFIAGCGGGGGGGSSPPAPTTVTIGGTVAGLTGSGLVLRNNAGNPLTVGANGAFTFGGTVASGSTYNVTVGTQPTSPTQACLVNSGAGTANANVTNVSVTCTTTAFVINVAIDGLFGTGLVLDNNGANPLVVLSNGTALGFTGVASGATYNVAVRTQPTSTPQQTCTVSSGTGTVGNGDATVAVSCRAQAGRFVYVAVAGATPAANAIAAFTIDASTGVLTPMAGSPFLTTGKAPRVVAGDPAGKFLYVFGDDNTASPGPTTMEGFGVDQQSGALTPIPGSLIDFPAAVFQAAFHPNGRLIYVAVTDGGLSGNNQLHGFAINQTTGALTSVPGFPLGAFAQGEVVNSVVLSPNGANLYLAISTPGIQPNTPPTGNIRQYAIDATTGALSATQSQVADAALTFNQLFMHPAGTHLYTRNIGPAAQTSRFTLDVVTGAIDSNARLDIGTAFGFGAVIVPGSVSRVYFPELGGTFGSPLPGAVAGYMDSSFGPTGAALPGSPWPTGGSNSLAAVLDPTSRFIALTNLGSHDVTVMKIDPVQGSLAHVPGSPYLPSVGMAPGTVTFDPSARFAYLTDGGGSISSYAIDVDTGHPTFVNSVGTGGVPGSVPVKILGSQ